MYSKFSCEDSIIGSQVKSHIFPTNFVQTNRLAKTRTISNSYQNQLNCINRNGFSMEKKNNYPHSKNH